MGIQEIKGEDYSIKYDRESVNSHFPRRTQPERTSRVCANSRIVR